MYKSRLQSPLPSCFSNCTRKCTILENVFLVARCVYGVSYITNLFCYNNRRDQLVVLISGDDNNYGASISGGRGSKSARADRQRRRYLISLRRCVGKVSLQSTRSAARVQLRLHAAAAAGGAAAWRRGVEVRVMRTPTLFHLQRKLVFLALTDRTHASFKAAVMTAACSVYRPAARHNCQSTFLYAYICMQIYNVPCQYVCQLTLSYKIDCIF